MNKKFILCVGVPKAGTTWLYRCLSAHSAVNLGHKKEYHVFDTYFYPELSSYRVKIPLKGYTTNIFYEKYLAEKKFDKELQDNHDAYCKYFAEILQNPSISITGDFTPTYCILRDNELRYIQLLMARYELDVHIIYLVRNPVERILSYARMAYKFKEYQGQPLLPNLSLNEFLANICFSQLNLDVTNYKNTILTLLKNFDDSKLYFGVYESMHTSQEIQRLSNFLGIAIDRNWPKYIINANAQSDFQFNSELIEKIKIKFQEQFLFCQQYFKDQNLSVLWRNYS